MRIWRGKGLKKLGNIERGRRLAMRGGKIREKKFIKPGMLREVSAGGGRVETTEAFV